MLRTNTALMKELKLLGEEKARLLREEKENFVYVQYNNEEADKPNYDYKYTRSEIEKINSRERLIKKTLAQANATVMIDNFNMTIGEGLVYLAQLNGNRIRLAGMAQQKEVVQERMSCYDNALIKTTRILYNKKTVQEELDKTLKTIADLQMAIDLANITHLNEID